MRNWKYTVAANGKIRVTNTLSKRPASRLVEEVPVPLTVRKAVRARLSPALVRGSWLLFGTRVLPADINELAPYRKVVEQVVAETPRLLAPIYTFVREGLLPETSPHLLALRLKDLLMRKNVKVEVSASSWGGKSCRMLRKNPTGADRYWHSNPGEQPLTEAGWRLFCRLPAKTSRVLFKEGTWTLRGIGEIFNQCAALQYPPLQIQDFDVLKLLLQFSSPNSQRNALLAYRNHLLAGKGCSAEELDFLRDRIREDRDRAVQPGTAWETLVEDAYEFAAAKVELESANLAGYQWPVPFVKLSLPEGITVTPLDSGVALLEEGIEMFNCLRNMESYAQRAAQGVSLVMRMEGGAIRATLELSRDRPGQPWQVSQVARKYNQQVLQGPLREYAKQVARHINGERA